MPSLAAAPGIVAETMSSKQRTKTVNAIAQPCIYAARPFHATTAQKYRQRGALPVYLGSPFGVVLGSKHVIVTVLGLR